ncbi:MAG: hypothetical protein ACJZZ9_02325 [Cytophagales bacterium]
MTHVLPSITSDPGTGYTNWADAGEPNQTRHTENYGGNYISLEQLMILDNHGKWNDITALR